jgi:hypothetical protein
MNCLPKPIAPPTSRALASCSACRPREIARTICDQIHGRAARTAASLSLLWWPYDHHRGLRARLPAHIPPHTRSARDQDRYLMTLSQPMDDRSGTPRFRWFVTGNASARHAFIASKAFATLILASTRQHATSTLPPRQTAAANSLSIPRHAKLLHLPAVVKSPRRPRLRPRTTSRRDFVPWRFSNAGQVGALSAPKNGRVIPSHCI